MLTAEDAFIVWAEDGRQRELPTRIEDAEEYPDEPFSEGHRVSVAWGETTKAHKTGSDTTRGYIETRELTPDERADATPEPDMLTIRQAAEYARVSERTIRDWLNRSGKDGKPMLTGAIQSGHKIRIPRVALDPWRKPVKSTHKPKTSPQKLPTRKAVKRKS